jgi:hypothetical protein
MTVEQPKSPQEVVAMIAELRASNTTLSARLDETQAALARSVGAGAGGAGVAAQTGIAAFRADSGGTLMHRSRAEAQVEIEGSTHTIEAVRPGLLDADARGLLSAEQAEARDRYVRPLAQLGALELGGYKGPAQLAWSLMVDLKRAAAAAPAEMREALAAHANATCGRLLQRSKRDGTFATSTGGGSGVAGKDWVPPEYLTEVLDVTSANGLAGFFDAAVPVLGGASLHSTEAITLRVLTGLGGYAQFGRQTTNTVAQFPLTDLTTTTADATGPRAVHSSLIDGKDLRDPRVLIDLVATHLRAGRLAGLVTSDLLGLHGSAQTVASSHPYAAAGLAAIAWDGRSTSFAGTNDDALLMADGLTAMARAQSTFKNGVSDAGLGAATDWLGSVANFLKAHIYSVSLLADQFQNTDGVALVLDKGALRKLQTLQSGVSSSEFVLFRPATREERARNPWYAGELYDGTMVFQHAYVGNGAYNTSGAIAASSIGLNSCFYAYLPALQMVRGPDHGRVQAEDVGRGDARSITTFYEQRLWNPTPVGTKTVVQLFNIDL